MGVHDDEEDPGVAAVGTLLETALDAAWQGRGLAAEAAAIARSAGVAKSMTAEHWQSEGLSPAQAIALVSATTRFPAPTGDGANVVWWNRRTNSVVEITLDPAPSDLRDFLTRAPVAAGDSATYCAGTQLLVYRAGRDGAACVVADVTKLGRGVTVTAGRKPAAPVSFGGSPLHRRYKRPLAPAAVQQPAEKVAVEAAPGAVAAAGASGGGTYAAAAGAACAAHARLLQGRSERGAQHKAGGGDGVAAATTRAKKDKDPNKPKRAASAYNCFLKANYERFAKDKEAQNAEGKFENKNVMKVAGSAWRSLSAAAKAPYLAQAAADHARHEAEMSNYVSSAAPALPVENACSIMTTELFTSPQVVFNAAALGRHLRTAPTLLPQCGLGYGRQHDFFFPPVHESKRSHRVPTENGARTAPEVTVLHRLQPQDKESVIAGRRSWRRDIAVDSNVRAHEPALGVVTGAAAPAIAAGVQPANVTPHLDGICQIRAPCRVYASAHLRIQSPRAIIVGDKIRRCRRYATPLSEAAE
jgi:hypothetical protein